MSRGFQSHTPTIAGRRIRALREELGWSQEKVGVAIGIDESSDRVRVIFSVKRVAPKDFG